MSNCNHEHTKKEYRVTCEDCGVLIMPDIFDRMRGIMDSMDCTFTRIEKLESNINNINTSISLIESQLNRMEVKNEKEI